MTNDWTFYLVDVCTGAVVADVSLSSFSGERSLLGGSLSAALPIAHLPYAQRREFVEMTTPGHYSIAAERNGVLVGEWVIWKRSRSNDEKPIALSGNELISILDRRVMKPVGDARGWFWTGVDQMYIARDYLLEGFAGSSAPLGSLGGAVAIDVPMPAASGQLRDRSVKTLDGTIGQRLKELSEVENGFDYLVETTRTGSTLSRTMRVLSPRAGVDLPYVFEAASSSSPAGNVSALTLPEDGTTLASQAYALGSTSNDIITAGQYSDGALIALGYPYFQRVKSWSDVTVQASIDSYARALFDNSQSAEQPITISVLADRFPAFGDYALGDRLAFVVEPSGNFPDGYSGRVRVLGWTHNPTGKGPEQLTLSIAKEPT